MKKIIFMILMVFSLGTAHTQCQQDNYVFVSAKTICATNMMASDAISRPFECKTFGCAAGFEWIGFFTDHIGFRLQGNLCFASSSAGEFNSAMIQGGIGLLASLRNGLPYGFFEARPRFDRSGTTLAYSQGGTRSFITATIGIGWDKPITPDFWFCTEGGISQSITYHNTYAPQTRDEIGLFLTIGVRYLMNYGLY